MVPQLIIFAGFFFLLEEWKLSQIEENINFKGKEIARVKLVKDSVVIP